MNIGSLVLANPVMPASGCFGPELAPVVPLAGLGAVVTKTVFSQTRSGNPANRLTEVPGGMLNSVGIPSVGMAAFRARVLPAYQRLGPPVVVSLGGLSATDFWGATAEIADARPDAFEINLSCPNLEHGPDVGSTPSEIERITLGVCDRAEGTPVIVKLKPNVGAIETMARAAEAGGAAAVTVANTYPAMTVNLDERRASLGNNTGGLSGPAVRPLVMQLVWQTASAVEIPVIACGGVTEARDAVEYLIAGATAVQVGTATFTRPTTMSDIIAKLPGLLDDLAVDTVRDLIGSLHF